MLADIKDHIEKMRIGPLGWLAGLVGILFVRFFLEALSNPSASLALAVDMPTLLHYGLFFLTVALFLMIFLNTFLPKLGPHIPKVAVIFFAGILIAPIIDLLAKGVGGSPMVYILDSPLGMLKSFFYLFSTNPPFGTTLGLQIEIAIILISIFCAIYFSTKNWLKSFLATLFFYAVLFTLCSMPTVLAIAAGQAGGPTEVINFIQKTIGASATLQNHIQSGLIFGSIEKLLDTGFNFMVARVFFLLSIGLSCLWFWKIKRELTLALLKNSRPERVGNYIFIIILGIFAALRLFPEVNLNWNDWLAVLSLFLSLYFSAMFAICVNDLEDVEIDKITNTDRPLAVNSASPEELRSASHLFLIGSLIAGYLSGLLPFFFILVFTALYYIYSAPPTRFKLIPIFSSFLIGLCCAAMFLAGFFLVSPLKVVSAIPTELTLIIFLFYFLFWHVRDMKDIKGDRVAHIPTLPVVVGEKWGRKVVGVVSGLAFLIPPLFIKMHLLWIPGVLAALATYYFVNKDPYSEKPIFITYVLFILSLALILFV